MSLTQQKKATAEVKTCTIQVLGMGTPGSQAGRKNLGGTVPGAKGSSGKGDSSEDCWRWRHKIFTFEQRAFFPFFPVACSVSRLRSDRHSTFQSVSFRQQVGSHCCVKKEQGYTDHSNPASLDAAHYKATHHMEFSNKNHPGLIHLSRLCYSCWAIATPPQWVQHQAVQSQQDCISASFPACPHTSQSAADGTWREIPAGSWRQGTTSSEAEQANLCASTQGL